MSGLSSTSTREDVLAYYDDNASWFEDDDIEKAKRFITACQILLRFPQFAARGNSTTSFSQQVVRDSMNEAKAFVRARASRRSGGAGIVYSEYLGPL